MTMQAKQYEVVLQDREGRIWQGEVVSYLSLSDWCVMKRYTVIQCDGFFPADGMLRTACLYPQEDMSRKMSGIHVIANNIRQMMQHLSKGMK
jgi:hypothetical protein